MKKGFLLVMACLILLSGCAFNTVRAGISASIEQRVTDHYLSVFELQMHRVNFSMIYTQTFSLGGFAHGHTNFSQGDSVTWKVEAHDQGMSSSYTTQRALVAKQIDGTSWWYLSLTSDEGEFAYAMLADAELAPLTIRFMDPNTGKPAELPFEKPTKEAYAQTDAYPGMLPESYDEEIVIRDPRDLLDHTISTERITVGAGSFDTKKLEYSYEDPDTGETFGYTWWVNSQVPGELVRFIWGDPKDESFMKGEITRIDRGFTTPLAP